MYRTNLITALFALAGLLACATPEARKDLWASQLNAGESLEIETRSGGCLSAPTHYRVRLEGPSPIQVQAWKLATCQHGVERERSIARGPVHFKAIHRFDAYLHTIRHPYPFLESSNWKTVELKWHRGSQLLHTESLQDQGELYVLTPGWMLSEVGLIQWLQAESE